MATKKRRTLSKAKSRTINRKKAFKKTSLKASKKVTRPKVKRRQRPEKPAGKPETAVIYEIVETEVYEPEEEIEEGEILEA